MIQGPSCANEFPDAGRGAMSRVRFQIVRHCRCHELNQRRGLESPGISENFQNHYQDFFIVVFQVSGIPGVSDPPVRDVVVKTGGLQKKSDLYFLNGDPDAITGFERMPFGDINIEPESFRCIL